MYGLLAIVHLAVGPSGTHHGNWTTPYVGSERANFQISSKSLHEHYQVNYHFLLFSESGFKRPVYFR